MATPCLLVLLLLGMLGSTVRAQNFYVAAPSILSLNSDETVAIAIDGDSGALVDVYIQDYPGKRNISQVQIPMRPGLPEIFKIRLDVNDFPEDFLMAPGSPKLVSLNARFLNNHKEIVIPISSQSGYMFIQTDKPIYTPKESAFFRIISLTEDALPSNDLFELQIRNPDNIIVKEKTFNDKNKKLDKAFTGHIYKFPKYPVLGEWSATVRFGHNLEQNSTVRFVLKEYVLPTFTVELKTPDVILPDAGTISVQVTARQVYGKTVKGVISFRLGVKSEHAAQPVYFAIFSPKELDKGEFTLRTNLDDLKKHKDIGWFPGIDKSRLVVEATVVDYATGNKEEATDSKAIFSNSPFLISFKRCLSDFKPGLTSVFEADITYVDGRPAEGVSTLLTAVANNGKRLQLKKNTSTSDANGRVAFEILPELHHKTVRLTLETNDPMYEKNQAKGTFEQHAFQSPSHAYIAISRSTHLTLKPGHTYARDIHFEPAGLQNIYYLVVARGKILKIGKLKPGAYKHQRVEVRITHDMVPDFRIVVFTHHGNELIADSLKIEVERECNPLAQVTIDPEFNEKEPGSKGKIIIRGTKDTSVGLLGVDEAVYALSKKDLLTKTKVFNKLSSHDLGCGPGGGVNINEVLGNAGIALVTNKYTPPQYHSCVEIKRRKREIAKEITGNFTSEDKQCCALGLKKDEYGRSCEDRKPIVMKLDEIYSNCSEVFMECCLNGKENGITDIGVISIVPKLRGDDFDEPEFIDADLQEEFERETTVRSDFRETWIYENILVGPDGREELSLSLPHSITTWVIQAVAVSPHHGICVAEPKKLVSFKKLFLHLNLPYSVVRNEQVEIQATVFNYGDKKVGVTVYMYGAEGLCSGTQPNQKSERKRLVVDAQSSASVSFPVIPLNKGNFKIKVVALSSVGSDNIEKQLYVVPEGITKEIHIPIKLDPSNQQRRKESYIETPLYSDHIDMTQNLQVTAIKLPASEGFVPGTASCFIWALGDMFGPVVETALRNPEGLLEKPRGCEEQNMMYLAPALYTMRYLKVSGRLTEHSEVKEYEFIQQGYGNELAYREKDGSYAAYKRKRTSTCVRHEGVLATTLVDIDDNVILSGVQWLIRNQKRDGSYCDNRAMLRLAMMGGVQGSTPMTAFALIAMEECKCNVEGLPLAKARAVAYLETHLGDVNKPLPVAIVAYALALSNSDMKQAAYDKLQSLAKYNEDNNWIYWTTDNSAEDIETTGYGLLTQLLFNDMGKSKAIVNWLNTKQLQSGSFKSTQDTVVALQALSEYAIRVRLPSMNLVSNISYSNDRNFRKVLTFRKENELILQDVQINKIGGTIFINTAGHGMGSMSVKLSYNVLQPPEAFCKFDVTVNVTDAKNVSENRNRVVNYEELIDHRANNQIPEHLIAGIKEELGQPVRRQDQDKVRLNLALCVSYLGKADAGMSIVDVGIFSGFEPVTEDLEKDTVVALQALSEYAIRAQLPSINLVSNISLSNDQNFHKVLTFREGNALILQDVQIDKIGGTVFINTAGHGMGSLSVKFRYNVLQSTEDVCKFDVTVNVTDAKNVSEIRNRVVNREELIDPRRKDQIPENLITGITEELGIQQYMYLQVCICCPSNFLVLRFINDGLNHRSAIVFGQRVRRQDQGDNMKVKLNLVLCIRYLGNADAGMSIVDVGIFSGFEPVVEDLEKLERDRLHLIDKYEKSSRGVVFYLEKVPIAESYCFSFHVIRQYLVGTTQMSVIKIYDYYNPDATCTKFYSPESNSPLIRTICEGGICECAEGGCPPQTPFMEIWLMEPNERREGLKTIFCENYDYVWKGRLDGRMHKNGGFLNITFRVEEVIKEGIEKAVDIEGATRTLLARDNCQTAHLIQGVTYLVLGKDGQAYKNGNGKTWYRYLLDQTSVGQLWTKIDQAPNRELQRYLNFVTKDLKEKGCEL